ncbi:hypothetical protein [Deinococcus altitudinis]|uniref:hypothetical protein n=1 Tax=Deinococcus altitudinis TaxID=468914 RepID=UPI003892156F
MNLRRTCTAVLFALALSCTTALAASLSLSGSYAVTGTNPDGARYDTSLEVSRSGETYRFVWGGDTVGVGVVVGRQVAVAYGHEKAAACGVVAYAVSRNGDLDGLWATGSSLGSEYAASATGPYRVNGRNPDGTRYSGTLGVYTVGPAYSLEWLIGKSRYVGVGIRQDRLLGVAYGADSCGVVVYTVSDTGTLEGDWTAFDVLDGNGKQGAGTETARPR